MKHQATFAFRLLALSVSAFWFPLSTEAQTRNEPQTIAIQITERGHIFVPVRVNDSEPLWFVLDSGSGSTLLNKRLIESLKLKVIAIGDAEGAGEGADEGLLTSGITFKLSGITLANQEVPAIDFKRLETSFGRNIDGLLGYDFMRRFVVEVNYEQQILRIYNAAKYRYRGRGEAFPITVEDGHPHVWLSVTFPKRKPLRGKFIVDGGAGRATMEFAAPFAKRHDLLRSVQIVETRSVAGIGGGVNIRYGRGEKIQLGRYVIRNPLVGFPQANRGAFANRKIAGLIGAWLLRRFTVIYDDRHKRIILEPNSSFEEP